MGGVKVSETKKIGLNGLAQFLAHIKILLNGKVDKETGKGLSTNDYTTAEKTKLAGMQDDLGTTDSPTFDNITITGHIIGGEFL